MFGSPSELYGRKPKVPGAIDYTKDLEEAITTNKNLLPELSAFAKLSTAEMANVLETAFPGYKGIRDTAGKGIASMLRGEVPADVQRQLEQKAAERGQSLGYGGSQFGENQFLRNFGLTSLQMVQQGLDSANKWINQAQNLSFDFSKFFLGKEDAMRRTEFNWQRDWLEAQVKAAPDPAKRGALDTDLAAAGMIMGVYGGGAGYQNTYRPTYSGTNPGVSGGGGNSYFGGGYGAGGTGGNIPGYQQGPNEGTGEGYPSPNYNPTDTYPNPMDSYYPG